MKKLSIKQKQEIYEYLLKKDCPDLLAALVAERSGLSVQSNFESLTLSDFIMGAFDWEASKEGHDFWSILRSEISEIVEGVPEEDFESPTEADFAPVGDDSAKIEILVDVSKFNQEMEKFHKEFIKDIQPLSLWTRIKLFFGRWNYKV